MFLCTAEAPSAHIILGNSPGDIRRCLTSNSLATVERMGLPTLLIDSKLNWYGAKEYPFAWVETSSDGFSAARGCGDSNSNARKLKYGVNRSELSEVRLFHLVAIALKHLSSHAWVASQFGTTSGNLSDCVSAPD